MGGEKGINQNMKLKEKGKGGLVSDPGRNNTSFVFNL